MQQQEHDENEAIPRRNMSVDLERSTERCKRKQHDNSEKHAQ
jgi:hypothetical protein